MLTKYQIWVVKEKNDESAKNLKADEDKEEMNVKEMKEPKRISDLITYKHNIAN